MSNKTFNRGQYLEYALRRLLQGKVWPPTLRRELESIVATANLYDVHVRPENQLPNPDPNLEYKGTTPK